jgi:hypothetical protein
MTLDAAIILASILRGKPYCTAQQRRLIYNERRKPP